MVEEGAVGLFNVEGARQYVFLSC